MKNKIVKHILQKIETERKHVRLLRNIQEWLVKNYINKGQGHGVQERIKINYILDMMVCQMQAWCKWWEDEADI